MSKIYKSIGLSDFPFIVDNPLEYLEKLGLPSGAKSILEAAELVGVQSRVREIVQNVLERQVYPLRSDVEALREALAFHATVAVLALLGDRRLGKRFAISVAKSVTEKLRSAEDKLIVALARRLGLNVAKHESDDSLKVNVRQTVSRNVIKTLQYSIPFVEYLKLSKRFWGDPNWKLTNQMLLHGRVYLERKKLLRLLEEKVVAHVEGLIEKSASEIMQETEVPSCFTDILTEVREKIAKIAARPQLESTSRVEGLQLPEAPVYEAFPPCLKGILTQALEGENLSHHQRFALATFMTWIGAGEEDILEVLRKLPDYNEKKAKYQIEHLMGKRGGGKKYLPYSCATMKTLGMCVAECNTKNPLEAYRRNLKAISRQAERQRKG
uniref:DNA primase large subunit PriL n=1 Tax=Fervidicoccus fontis TaxID=683846 RepID=A0A7J3ZJD7_9CREN